jgi:hypothetical protein
MSFINSTNKNNGGNKMKINLVLEINKELSRYKDKDKRFFEELYKNFLEQDNAIVSVEIK